LVVLASSSLLLLGARSLGTNVTNVELSERANEHFYTKIVQTADGYDAGGLVLLRNGLRIETGTHDAQIVGVIENRRHATSFNAWVLFDLYDENGTKIGEAGAERNNDFPEFHSWHFAAVCPRKTTKMKLAKLGGHWYSN
jgi:hypothetical protein